MTDPFRMYQQAGLQHGAKPQQPTFTERLSDLINQFSKENDSGTPDYILAEYLAGCLDVYNKTIKARADWRGERIDAPLHTKNKVKIILYDAHGRKNEIGEAQLEVWPGETARYGPISNVIAVFAEIPPSGFTEYPPSVEQQVKDVNADISITEARDDGNAG